MNDAQAGFTVSSLFCVGISDSRGAILPDLVRLFLAEALVQELDQVSGLEGFGAFY